MPRAEVPASSPILYDQIPLLVKCRAFVGKGLPLNVELYINDLQFALSPESVGYLGTYQRLTWSFQ